MTTSEASERDILTRLHASDRPAWNAIAAALDAGDQDRAMALYRAATGNASASIRSGEPDHPLVSRLPRTPRSAELRRGAIIAALVIGKAILIAAFGTWMGLDFYDEAAPAAVMVAGLAAALLVANDADGTVALGCGAVVLGFLCFLVLPLIAQAGWGNEVGVLTFAGAVFITFTGTLNATRPLRFVHPKKTTATESLHQRRVARIVTRFARVGYATVPAFTLYHLGAGQPYLEGTRPLLLYFPIVGAIYGVGVSSLTAAGDESIRDALDALLTPLAFVLFDHFVFGNLSASEILVELSLVSMLAAFANYVWAQVVSLFGSKAGGGTIFAGVFAVLIPALFGLVMAYAFGREATELGVIGFDPRTMVIFGATVLWAVFDMGRRYHRLWA